LFQEFERNVHALESREYREYQRFSKNYIENFNEKIDCADLAIACLVDFPNENALPVKLKHFAGGWKWVFLCSRPI
jgi:hypothetical protein